MRKPLSLLTMKMCTGCVGGNFLTVRCRYRVLGELRVGGGGGQPSHGKDVCRMCRGLQGSGCRLLVRGEAEEASQ